MNDDLNSSADAKVEAEAAYKDAVAELARIIENPQAPKQRAPADKAPADTEG